MLVQVWRDGPSTMVEVEEEHHAFANMDEEANCATASSLF